MKNVTQLKEADLISLRDTKAIGLEKQIPVDAPDGLAPLPKAPLGTAVPLSADEVTAIANFRSLADYLVAGMKDFPGADGSSSPFNGTALESKVLIGQLNDLAKTLANEAKSLHDTSDQKPPAGAGKGERYHYLTFELVRKDEDQSAWMEILRPGNATPGLHRRMSVGFEKDGMVQEMVSWVRPTNLGETQREGGKFFLDALPLGRRWFVGSFFLAALLMLGLLSGLLREPDAPPRPDGAAPYSLARCQMALWFFLISLAFVFLWQMLGRKDTVNNTAVVLLGISSFTAVGSAIITNSNRPSPLSRRDLLKKCGDLKAPLAQLRQDLVKLQSDTTAAQTALSLLREGKAKLAAELAQLETKVPDPDPTGAETEKRTLAEKRAALVRQGQEIAEKEREIDRGTKAIGDAADCILAQEKEEADYHARLAYAGALGVPGFFNDLLRDGDQHLSIARFQMMIWTLVLAFVFTVEVYSTLSMPEFNPALLALLGITSGTYLGFKGATQSAPDKKT